MLRPLPAATHDAVESDDDPSLDGLADVLEPNDDVDAITSRRGASMASVRHAASPPPSVRAPARPASAPSRAVAPVPDFAFADTVIASELPGDEAPESAPIFVNDRPQCLAPLAFPPVPASDEEDLQARLRSLFSDARHRVRCSHHEMRELWADTAAMVADDAAAPSPWRSLPRVVRRVVAAWSCFQWSRDDLTRALLIGFAVFITAAAVGAATLDGGDAAAAGDEVRQWPTLDRHPARDISVRRKR